MRKRAIIIGAGPAGLTAAYELLWKTTIQPVILEKSGDIGGISKTVNYKGNRIDIGGHRFFSKSERVMKWWLNILPLDQQAGEAITLNYQQKSKEFNFSSYPQTVTSHEDKVMLVRNRLSRIFHEGKFFSYPLSLSTDTASKLGFIKLSRIFLSYSYSRLFPPKEVKTLEDFFIKQFGKELYLTFFKNYTEKVWGVPCNEINAEWGAQRIKGLSVGKVIIHAFRDRLTIRKDKSLLQKDTQTSLIERFLYPKYGPGQLWEEVAERIITKGGELLMYHEATAVHHKDNRITGITTICTQTGKEVLLEGDYFFSTMPVSELIGGFKPKAPARVTEVAAGLAYRDFITIGVLLKELSIKDTDDKKDQLIRDNWIYIQDDTVRMGRLQVFNNWSPSMVKEPGTIWLGLEYFCLKGDDLWNMSDETFKQFAVKELVHLGFINNKDVLDSTIVRMEKAYPAYFGTYDKFETVKDYANTFENLFLIGRNGMHKYNNSDHSMLTAIAAVDNIINGIVSKENIWAVNTEQDYHETSG